jgi:hypothetical protein
VKFAVLLRQKVAYMEPAIIDGIRESKLALDCQLAWMPSL